MNSNDAIAALDELFVEARRLGTAGDFDTRHRLLWGEAELIRRFLTSFQLDHGTPGHLAAYVNDALPRFLHTIEMLPVEPGLRVLELGANPYLLSILMARMFDYRVTMTNFFDQNIFAEGSSAHRQAIASREFGEGHEFEYTALNLEQAEYPFPEGSFDLIMFCEILEHLVIDPLPVLDRLRRMLTPGGLLILTTPNAVRLANYGYMLAGSNFFDRYHPEYGVFGRHNREFTVEELERVLRERGFAVQVAVTKDRYNYNRTPITKDNYETPIQLPYTADDLERLLHQSGGNLENRGDNIYLVARAPGEGVETRSNVALPPAVATREIHVEPAIGVDHKDWTSHEVNRLREELAVYKRFWSQVQTSLVWRSAQLLRSLVGRKW